MEEQDATTKVTLKYGKGYEAPWLTFGGSPAEIRAQIIEAFALEGDEGAQTLSLAELVTRAATRAHALYEAATRLGATPTRADIPRRGGSQPSAVWSQAATPANDTPASEAQPATAAPAPWEGPAAPAGAEKDPLIALIEAQTDRKGLARVWKEHQAEFEREDVKAAMAAAQKRVGK